MKRLAACRHRRTSHAANAAVGADAESTLRAPFVSHKSMDFGPLLRRIGRPGTVWWLT
jgi:hypothetical protein